MKKHTQTDEHKASQNTLLLWKGLVSLPSFCLTLYQTKSPSPLQFVKHGPDSSKLSVLIPHLELIRGPPEAQAYGPINNHSAELWVRQQSADEPVSTKHKPLPPSLPQEDNSHF